MQKDVQKAMQETGTPTASKGGTSGNLIWQLEVLRFELIVGHFKIQE